MVKTNNYSFLKYLNQYDLISKYNLKSVYMVPQINKINLSIAIEQNFAVKLKAQYKAFLFYYLYNFCCSKIILNFFTSLKKRVKTMTLKSKVLINVSNKKIFDFLIFLIFSLNNKLLETNYTLTNTISNIASGKFQHEYLHLLFAVPISTFLGKTNQNQQQINFNDLIIFFNFSLKKSVKLLPFNFFEEKKINLYKNFFRNIFIFWALKI